MRNGWRGMLGGAVLVVGLTAGCAEVGAFAPPRSTPTSSTDVTGSAAPLTDRAGAPVEATGSAGPVDPVVDAAAALAALPVKGRAPKTGYERDRFGQSWADVDGNGCDQRNDVLARDLVGETFKPGTRDCVVLTGRLPDPYTGSEISFTRGQDTSDAVQIDHVVALSNAWQTGAQQLDPATRRLFGNDPLNLLAVDGPTNQQKGDADAATWLPPVRAYRCAYVARQVAVKAKYRLWVTAAERDAIAGILGGCPGQPLPPDSTVPATAPA